jgi:hypothetical protein
MGQSNYSLFLNSNTTGTNEHNLSNNTFYGTDPNGINTSSPVSVFSNDGGDVNSDGDSFLDVTASYAFYISYGSSEIENATFSNISGYSLYASGGDHDISDTTFDTVSTVSTYAPAMYFYANSGMNISLSDINITNSAGDGISATTYDAVNSPINLDIDTVNISNSGDDGIYLYGAQANIVDSVISGGAQGINTSQATVNISDSIISGASSEGLSSVGSDITVDGSAFSANGTKGLFVTGGTFTGFNITADGNAEAGLEASGEFDVTIDSSEFINNLTGLSIIGVETSPATFSITNNIFNQNSETGLSITYADGTADSNTATNNQMYGMVCEYTAFTSCDANSLIGNIMGEQTGCDETCGVEANQ